MHYFAAEMGCIEEGMDIKGRVDRKYQGESIAESDGEEDSKEKLEELEKEKHKERFELWEKDRELYNHKYEVEQLKENWAIWLKKGGTFGPGGLFGEKGSDKKEKIEKLNREFGEFADEQLALFRNDLGYTNKDRYIGNTCEARESKEYRENELLMKNPSYLVQKSRHYIAMYYNKEVKEDYEYKKKQEENCSEEGERSGFMALFFGVSTKRAIDYSVDFAERAVDLDYKFAWNGYNMMAITKLIRDGEGVTDYDEAESAAGIKQSFYTDLATTRNSLESFIIPKQLHECGSLIISQVVKKNSDTVRQCLFILKAYEKISKHLESLMETVAKAKGDEMIRPSKMYGAEELLNKIDAKDLEEGFEMVIEPIEAKQEKEKLEKDLDEGKITEEEYQRRLKEIRMSTLGKIGLSDKDNLFNKASKSSFRAMTEDLSHDLNLIGFIGFDIAVYELEKDWTDTIIAGLLSIATIAIGIAFLPAGGFLGVLGTSLIAQSVLELVQIGISIDQGIPIDLGEFIKSKGIGVAVAIITAGIAKGLESSGMVSAKNIPGFEGLKTGVSKAAFIKAGVFEALKMSAIMGAVDVTTRYVAKKYMEKNDGSIEDDIEDAIKAVLSSYSEEITKILLNDRFNNKFKSQSSGMEMQKIVDGALRIIADYASHGAAKQIISGSVTKVASHFGAIPGAITGLASIGAGYNKAGNAVDKLKEKLKEVISKQASRLSGTAKMMEAKLMQDFPKEAEMIMESISGGGLLINGGEDIDYNNCNRYQEVEEKSKRGVVGECEYIADLREEAKKEHEKLKSELVRASLGPIRGIYTREVAQPIISSRIVDPIVGGALRAGVEHVTKAFKNSWEKREGRIEEQEKYRARMKGQLDGITKGEQGKYEYVGEGRKVEHGMVWDALNQDNVGGALIGGRGDSYVCSGGMCKAEAGSKIGGNKEGEKWSKVAVKKGETVSGMYGGKEKQGELEAFIETNPYITARGVERDGDGNIKHLEIRAGEEIWIPENIAVAYQNKGSNAANTGGAAQG